MVLCLVCLGFFFIRKEPEEAEEAEEAAPICRMWTDGSCWRFSHIKAHAVPDRQAPQWEEIDAHRTSSKDTLPLWIFGIFCYGCSKFTSTFCLHNGYYICTLICRVRFLKYGLSIRRNGLNCTHFQQQFKLLSQPDNTEILGYTLGLLSFVIACTSRFPAICRAVSGTQHKSVFMSKQHHSAFSYREVF